MPDAHGAGAGAPSSRLRRRTLSIAAAFIAAVFIAASLGSAGAAWAAVTVVGHGWGHGVGMAQYGAMGFAREEGRSFRWILRHYYPGTRTGTAPRTVMRVRLKETTAARVKSATLLRDARGRRVRTVAGRTYRVVPWRDAGLRVIDRSRRRTLARLHAPVRATGARMSVGGRSENGVSDGRYRGAIVLSRSADRVLVVNEVDLEHYLYGVVPGEMPASWPAHALRAQAVAARSYAVRSRRRAAGFDVFADTRSQVYGGVGAERRATTAAVRKTRRRVVMAGTQVVRAFFHSSSGGRTAAIEDIFGGPPIRHFRSVSDRYDRLSPHHDWRVRMPDAEARRRLRRELDGDLRGIRVVARTAQGRALTVRLTGTSGVRHVPAATVSARLGLRSTWFTVRRSGVR